MIINHEEFTSELTQEEIQLVNTKPNLNRLGFFVCKAYALKLLATD